MPKCDLSLCGTPLSQFFGFGIRKTNSPRPQHIPRNERFWGSNRDRSVCVVVCPHRVLGPHTQIKGIEDLVPSARHLWLGAGWGRARGRWAEPGLWWGALAGPDPEQCWFQVVLPAPGGEVGGWGRGLGTRLDRGLAPRPWLIGATYRAHVSAAKYWHIELQHRNWPRIENWPCYRNWPRIKNWPRFEIGLVT